jgi:hypothetical protein
MPEAVTLLYAFAGLQTNGVSIYHHQHHDEATGIGGEYMVSAVCVTPCSQYLWRLTVASQPA